ncbi:MAG: Uma2 family endonuclease [Gemmataceae bacterium]
MTPTTATGMPTHKDLPDTDGAIVENYQELPQTTLLRGCLRPRLRELCPDGRFSVGSDSGIYWRRTDPPLKGCKSPDFFIVLGVDPMLDGEIRRSYVMWQEIIAPLIVMEYVSGDGSEEHDRTPYSGKFWVYEQAIRAPYYLIFDGWRRTLEVYKKNGGGYHAVEPNANGRFPVPELGVEFGLWDAVLDGMDAAWVRPWDIATGRMLPSAEESAAQERARAEAAEGIVDDLRREAGEQAEQARQQNQRAEQERQRADEMERRAARLAELMRQAGLDPDAA